MLLITGVAERAEALAGKERDALVLTFEERRWARRRLKTQAGREVALALLTGTALEPGSIVAVEADFYIAVEAAEEPVLAVVARDRAEAVRVAFEVGNRHYPLAIAATDGALLVPDDATMERLFAKLGARFERRRAVFAPIGGSPVGHGHGHE